MRDYLLFRLYGPLASWGETAVGEVRPSGAWPGRSAVIGLLAAALGVRRDEEERQRQLADSYAVAVCVESPGELLRDYHTTQVPPERRGIVHRTRRDELKGDTLHTILSQRDYRADALYTVALWCKGNAESESLEQLAEALKVPKFTIYMGRKSCPVALPLSPQTVQAGDLRSAFDVADFPDTAWLKPLPRPEERIFVWDEHEAAGMSAIHVSRRRDEPTSRRRWQFGERDEYYLSEPRTIRGRGE